MARTTCSVGGDSNQGWRDAVYRPSRQCSLTQYFCYILSHCSSEMDLNATYKVLNGDKGGNGDVGWHSLAYPFSQRNHRDAKDTLTVTG